MIIVIAAMGSNNELGKNNNLIWHLQADLKRFKKLTTGHTIIMGRNTFESIGKPLPNRKSVIITRNRNYRQEGCKVVHSLEEALQWVKDDEKAFIIGGSQIYEESLKKGIVDQLDVTLIHENFDADVFFPEIEKQLWKESSREDFKANMKDKYDYSFIRYRKR